MLHGPIWNKLPRFALPVAATAILEQLFNASDIAVVGKFTGELKTIAVAAVGANSPIIALIVNLFIGIALGANVVIANAVGRSDEASAQFRHAVVFYPSATSRIIITLNPTAKKTVPRLEWRPCDISGISSSATT